MASRFDTTPLKGTTMATILPGDTVSVHYTTRSLEGSVIESSDNREPIRFVADSDEVIRGLSDGVLGLRVGDRKTLSVSPDLGFGRNHPDLVQQIPRCCLPAGTIAGDQIAARSGPNSDSEGIDIWVQRVSEDVAFVDANHPLAGETLVIDIEIVAVES
ncbi:MAG: FKBP-type peptidyl-prolyl cis-trans isomerase [Planctomycetaceae bacterium]